LSRTKIDANSHPQWGNVLISNVDDHLRNHGFPWLGRAGGFLSPACDLNPVPADLKACVLTTNIDPDEGTCSLELLELAARFYGLALPSARAIIKVVVTATCRDTAKATGARSGETTSMASAFEHDDLKRALALYAEHSAAVVPATTRACRSAVKSEHEQTNP
jgi:serine/threonine-protein kinase HipA